MMRNKIVLIIGRILLFISIIFILKKFFTINIDWGFLMNKDTLLIFTLLSIAYAVLQIYLSIPWVVFIKNKNSSIINMMYIYCKANLYKYIPGNVMHFVGRNEVALSENIQYSMVNMASTFEIIMLVFTSVSVSILLNYDNTVSWISKNIDKIAFIFLVGLVVIFILITIFNKKIKILLSENYATLKKINIRKNLLCSMVIYFGYFCINGFMMCIVFKVVGSIDIAGKCSVIIGQYALSWLIGYITVGSPGGIGIREAMMCVILSGLVQENIILASVISYRLINIIGEIIAFISMYLLKRMTTYIG